MKITLYGHFIFFLEIIRLDISCEVSASQAIHMKCQVLFSQKNKTICFKMLSVAVVTGALKYFHFFLSRKPDIFQSSPKKLYAYFVYSMLTIFYHLSLIIVNKAVITLNIGTDMPEQTE